MSRERGPWKHGVGLYERRRNALVSCPECGERRNPFTLAWHRAKVHGITVESH